MSNLEEPSKAKENDFNKKPYKMIGLLEKNEKEAKNLVKNKKNPEIKENSKATNGKEDKSLEEEIESRIEGTKLKDYYKIKEWLKTGGSGYVFRADFIQIFERKCY